MIEKPVGSLVNFGAGYWFLLHPYVGIPLKGDYNMLWQIDRFLAVLDELGLTVTRRASADLIDLRKSLDAGAEEKLSQEQSNRLQRIMQTIRPTLLAEAGGLVAYMISERRIPIEKLLDGTGSLFAKDVFEQLSEIAKQDFNEAGKCLAFERSTAAAFHMLRATEENLKNYYCKKVTRNRVTLMWAPIVAAMKAAPKKFPAALVNHLDHIRSGFRNPTAHPEKMYDIDEAQDLLSICIDVANRMTLDLKGRN